MNNLHLNQQSINSWTVTDEKSGVLVAWITQLQNRLGKNNQTYQVVVRSDMRHEFMTHEHFKSLEEINSFLHSACFVGGES